MIFQEFQKKYLVQYSFGECKSIDGNLVGAMSFTERYIQDWHDRWKEKPGVTEMVEVLRGKFAFELRKSGGLIISCSSYREEHADFIRPELLFHFRDFCHNLTSVFRGRGLCPSFLTQAVDCIGENLTFDDLANGVREYLQEVLKEAADLLNDIAGHFESELSSFFGRHAPFIFQIGLKDQVRLFEITNLETSVAKDLDAIVSRLSIDAKSSQRVWAMALLEASYLTEFFSRLSNTLAFMLGVYSNQTNVSGLYIGIVGLAASLLSFGFSTNGYLQYLVSAISVIILTFTCARWLANRSIDVIRNGVSFIRRQISLKI
jgi:hypothetical protein